MMYPNVLISPANSAWGFQSNVQNTSIGLIEQLNGDSSVWLATGNIVIYNNQGELAIKDSGGQSFMIVDENKITVVEWVYNIVPPAP